MGRRHSHEEILAGAVQVVLDHGLSGLTFAKVAAQVGASDRMVVYYFGTKDILVESVILELAGSLMESLDEAFGDEAPKSVDVLARRAWSVLATRRNDPVFRMFFELVGLGSARKEPYARLSREVLKGWSAWLAPRVAGVDQAEKSAQALALMASIDGLLLIRQTLGPRAADSAFRARFGSVG